MKEQFDELAKTMAQSATRRAALKKFGVGLAGMVLACVGLADKAEATTKTGTCEQCIHNCMASFPPRPRTYCHKYCQQLGYC
jgi:hypothetical protein